MRKSVKLVYGVLILSIGLVLPTSAFASDTGNEQVVEESVQSISESLAADENQAVQATNEEASAEETEVVQPKQVTEPLATAKTDVEIEINTPVTPLDFVTVKSGVSLSYKTEPDVASTGNKSVTIIATDGVTTEEIVVNYEVWDDTPRFGMYYGAPIFDFDKSDALNIYGQTVPNALVVAFFKIENGFDATAWADKYGNFHIKLKEPLKNHEAIQVSSMTLFDDQKSEVTEYIYTEKLEAPKQTNKPIVGKVKVDKMTKGTANNATEILPKTGDANTSRGIIAVGALTTLLATIYLRKRG